ncbi:MAG: chromosome partitioning protein [Treponema sp.]|jgi:phage shock protein A|nr:chromosome partitioning protein [Treponema sp.]
MLQDTENIMSEKPAPAASVGGSGRVYADDDLSGMEPASAREYIASYITTLKLWEKETEKLSAGLSLWESRVNLARSKETHFKGAEELILQAEKEAALIRERISALDGEIETLKTQIEKMKRQLPALEARARSVDPDLLEQELLAAVGYLPGDEEKATVDRNLKAMMENASTDAALVALKKKMGKGE